ncbi:MAG: M28 family peptidase [candidate division WOR-3 bacterium]
MKSIFFLFLNCLFATEVLIQVNPSEIRSLPSFCPVATLKNLVIGRIEETELKTLSPKTKILTTLPVSPDELFYLVSPSPYLSKEEGKRLLTERSEILTEDGYTFFVKGKEKDLISLLPSGFEITNISLKPIILSEPAKEEPPLLKIEPNSENPVIQEILARITPTEVAQLVRELSGEVPVMIQGHLDTIRTRYALASKNSSAGWYIYEKFQSFNLDSVNFHTFTWSGNRTDSNVIGTKNGRVYPHKYWIIGGHFDCISESPSTYAPGADDNASGTVAAIIAAKYMSPYPWKYTIKFINWNAEEFGLYGSDAHARLVRNRDDSIMGVLNADMIATEMGSNMVEVYTSTRLGSRAIGDTFYLCNERYNIGLSVRRSTEAPSWSDHYSYWQQNYEAICAIEYDFCPYYHTTQDRITASSFDTIFFARVVKNLVATLATLAIPDTEINTIREEKISSPLSSLRVSPNPCGHKTKISFLPNGKDKTLKIYNTNGELVNSFTLPPKGIVWDGRDKNGQRRPGIYFLKMEFSNQEISQKLILLE